MRDTSTSSDLGTPVAPTSHAAEAFSAVRRNSVQIASPLSAEDCQVQSMLDASPIKWHLAHTTWFYETFILEPHARHYACFDSSFKVLFNSYYNTVGDKHPRPDRGLLSRPSLDRVLEYRAHVDAAMHEFLADEVRAASVFQVITLGLNHEQQHQELMLTDLKHLLSVNPLSPRYEERDSAVTTHTVVSRGRSAFAGGLIEVGHRGESFCFDNETPRHQVFLRPYQLADQLVTNGDYLAFMGDGGYTRHELWLSEGWDRVNAQRWQAPNYWREDTHGGWSEFTLHGAEAIDLNAPVCHVSFFEADAYARWIGARLPSEAEWEHAAAQTAATPLTAALHPGAATASRLTQLYGSAWQWTSSAYLGYPGFTTAEGAVGEYNGKFMCNQFVLRGSSVATPAGHERVTYRNFFPPDKRWQFTGIRLAY